MSSSNYILYKGASAVAITFALSKYWLGEQDLYNNLEISWGSVAGLIVGNYVGSYAWTIIGSSQIDGVNESTILERVIEIGAGTGAGYLVNRFVLGNSDWNASSVSRKLPVLALSDIGSEYVAEYLTSQPLSYL